MEAQTQNAEYITDSSLLYFDIVELRLEIKITWFVRSSREGMMVLQGSANLPTHELESIPPLPPRPSSLGIYGLDPESD